MDPQRRDTLIELARVEGLFDTDFAPDEELDHIDAVETADGTILILTGREARAYAMVAADQPEGLERHAVAACTALERLGALRAARLEDLARDAVSPNMGALRDRVAVLLERAVEASETLDPTDGDGTAFEAAGISDLARAWRDLEPSGELLPAVAQTMHVAGGPLAAVVDPPSTVTVDDVTARRVAGHVYQRVQGAGHQAEAAEAARAAVLEALNELLEAVEGPGA